jgi:hypothetical protein
VYLIKITQNLGECFKFEQNLVSPESGSYFSKSRQIPIKINSLAKAKTSARDLDYQSMSECFTHRLKWRWAVKSYLLIAIASLSIGLVVGCGDVSFKAKAKKSDGDGGGGGPGPGGCTSNCNPPGDPVTQVFNIPAANNKVDILFVVDNSRSMAIEQANLGDKFNNFISSLNVFDWQIGITTTDMNGTGATQDGKLLTISGTASKILKKNDPNADINFKNTVKRPETGFGDERGIYAAIKALDRNENGLVRSGSTLAVVVLADEDERSIACLPGDSRIECQAGGAYATYTMESGKDYAVDLINKVKSKYGASKTFSVHPIIIRPGDESCRTIQNNQSGVTGHFGTVYAEAANETGGMIGSVCSSNWGAQLQDIGNVIIETRDSLTFPCTLFSAEVLTYPTGYTPANGFPYFNGNKLFFSPALQSGQSVTVRYRCVS